MVDPGRYLLRHEAEAARIEKLLTQFGRSGGTPGFWCSKGAHTGILDCIRCEHDNCCHHGPPPLDRRYDPDSEGRDLYLGDHMLLMLAENRVAEDALWLQHPETRR